jgi:hypothetical protein
MTSVRTPSASGCHWTRPGICSSKLGQPQFDLNFDEDSNSSVPHRLQV